MLTVFKLDIARISQQSKYICTIL